MVIQTKQSCRFECFLRIIRTNNLVRKEGYKLYGDDALFPAGFRKLINRFSEGLMRVLYKFLDTP